MDNKLITHTHKT